jgi:hypothetical protein
MRGYANEVTAAERLQSYAADPFQLTPMKNSSRDATPARPPRTFELRDAEWIDTTPKRPRAPLWLLVPAALIALSSLVLVAFAAIVALATGGIFAARALIRERSGRLRERFARHFRR